MRHNNSGSVAQHFECAAVIICRSNHRVGVPVFFEDREWRHNLQSQFLFDHATRFHCSAWQWLLNVRKSVRVNPTTQRCNQYWDLWALQSVSESASINVYLFQALRLCLCIFDSRSGREHDSKRKREFGVLFAFWFSNKNDYNVHKVRAGLHVHSLSSPVWVSVRLPL